MQARIEHLQRQRRQCVPRLPAARSGAGAEAGRGPAHPQRRGLRRRRHLRSAPGRAQLRARVPRGTAADDRDARCATKRRASCAAPRAACADRRSGGRCHEDPGASIRRPRTAPPRCCIDGAADHARGVARRAGMPSTSCRWWMSCWPRRRCCTARSWTRWPSAAGPAAFTGVRLAASVTQGLAFGAGLPVVPVSDLRALAQRALDHEPARRSRARLQRCAHAGGLLGVLRARRPAGRAVAVGAEHVGKPELVPLPPQWSARQRRGAVGRRHAASRAYPQLRALAPPYGCIARGPAAAGRRDRAAGGRGSRRRAGCSRPPRPFRSICAMMWRRCQRTSKSLNLTPDRFCHESVTHALCNTRAAQPSGLTACPPNRY